RIFIERGDNAGKRKERFRLGSERKVPAIRPRVERLDPESVASDQEPAPLRIPQREAVHAVERADQAISQFPVQRDDDFRIRPGEERVAASFELAAELAKIVD